MGGSSSKQDAFANSGNPESDADRSNNPAENKGRWCESCPNPLCPLHYFRISRNPRVENNGPTTEPLMTQQTDTENSPTENEVKLQKQVEDLTARNTELENQIEILKQEKDELAQKLARHLEKSQKKKEATKEKSKNLNKKLLNLKGKLASEFKELVDGDEEGDGIGGMRDREEGKIAREEKKD